MIKFSNHKEKKLLLLQRNEYLTKKQIKIRKNFGRYLFCNFFINYFQDPDLSKKVSSDLKQEFDQIKPFLPKKIKTSLDIGCGIGLIDIYLNSFYPSLKNIYLLDKNQIDKKIVYGFSKNYESYNDISTTKYFLNNNGIPIEKLKLIDVEKNFFIAPHSIDLCISLVSMGYHYPIENYIDLLRKITKSDTIFIFDIAEEYISIKKLKSYFNEIKIINHKSDTKHPRFRVCCKNIK